MPVFSFRQKPTLSSGQFYKNREVMTRVFDGHRVRLTNDGDLQFVVPQGVSLNSYKRLLQGKLDKFKVKGSTYDRDGFAFVHLEPVTTESAKTMSISDVRRLIREELVLSESEVYFYRGDDGQMWYHDDEGNTGLAAGNAPAGETLSYSQASQYMRFGDEERMGGSYSRGKNRYRPPADPEKTRILGDLATRSKSRFAQSVLDQVRAGRRLSEKQITIIHRMLRQSGAPQTDVDKFAPAGPGVQTKLPGV